MAVKKFDKPELMAPAGDFSCLDAALAAGADAVYFGLRGMNMRAGARNFELSDLRRISKMCRSAGAKAYLALNSIYFDGESRALAGIVKAAARNSIDAVIAWDLSAVAAARAAGLPVFLSTQASVSNASAAAQYYSAFGVRRFVLARECTLDDIARMRARLAKILGKRAACGIEIEVFAHGAMCVSLSGRCFMSQFQCGKSANRGECAQPCRREYIVRPKPRGGSGVSAADSGELAIGQGYVLSPKDLCTLPFLEKLVEAGADSLKIEGRNRNAQYVETVVSAYRRALDFYFERRETPDFERAYAELKGELLERLASVFTRGFSEGFFMGKPVGDWTSAGNEASAKKVIVGRVLNYYPRVRVAEISVDDSPISVGDRIYFEGPSTGYFSCEIGSMRSAIGEVRTARKGDIVGVKVPRRARRSDRVYAVR